MPPHIDQPTLLYLSAEEVRRALPMREAITAARDAFVQLSSGEATVPPRMRVAVAGEKAQVLLMPCHSAKEKRLSLKFVSVFEENPPKGLPLIQALVILADAETGAPLAILDGGAITALRTGAASGAATDALARPDSATAAIFGAGIQGRTQLEAVCAVRPIRRARVFDVAAEAAESFAREMSERLGIAVEPAANPGTALAGVDVVCTATTCCLPVFEDGQVPPGAHINAVGSFHVDAAEIPPETVRRARVVVDQVEAALEEAGDLVLPLRRGLIGREHFSTELGQVLLGRAAGRESAGDITLFKSVGLAIQDLCAAARAFENARRLGIGTPLPR